jgi:hypothetical protein
MLDTKVGATLNHQHNKPNQSNPNSRNSPNKPNKPNQCNQSSQSNQPSSTHPQDTGCVLRENAGGRPPSGCNNAKKTAAMLIAAALSRSTVKPQCLQLRSRVAVL